MIDKLKRLLAERNIKQSDFEPSAGLPRGRLTKWFSGKGEPTASQSLRIARTLGVPLEELIEGDPTGTELIKGDQVDDVPAVEAQPPIDFLEPAPSEEATKPAVACEVDDDSPDDPVRSTRFRSKVATRFGDKLRRLIERSDTNQSLLARRSGIAQSAISEIILGKRRPYLDQAFVLAQVMGVPLDYLADDSTAEVPYPTLDPTEQRVRDIVVEIGPDEAWRRLIGSTSRPRSAGEVPPDELSPPTSAD